MSIKNCMSQCNNIANGVSLKEICLLHIFLCAHYFKCGISFMRGIFSFLQKKKEKEIYSHAYIYIYFSFFSKLTSCLYLNEINKY